jgi:hypothetical protein
MKIESGQGRVGEKIRTDSQLHIYKDSQIDKLFREISYLIFPFFSSRLLSFIPGPRPRSRLRLGSGLG